MALQDSPDSGGKTATSGSSALAGLPAYWDVAKCPPKREWEKWWDLFVMAVNSKDSISVQDLTRTPTENLPRLAALINNMNEQAVERKTVRMLFLSLGSAGRKI